jgi:hypothetical protein
MKEKERKRERERERERERAEIYNGLHYIEVVYCMNYIDVII